MFHKSISWFYKTVLQSLLLPHFFKESQKGKEQMSGLFKKLLKKMFQVLTFS